MNDLLVIRQVALRSNSLVPVFCYSYIKKTRKKEMIGTVPRGNCREPCLCLTDCGHFFAQCTG